MCIRAALQLQRFCDVKQKAARCERRAWSTTRGERSASKTKHSFRSYLHFNDYVVVQARDDSLAVVMRTTSRWAARSPEEPVSF